MSFKVKDKTVYLSLMSLIALTIVVTFCLVVYQNPAEYSETLKMVLMLVIGSLFKIDNGDTPKT